MMLAAKHGARKTLCSIKKEGCGFIKGRWKLLESVFIRQRFNQNLLLLGTKGRMFALVSPSFRAHVSVSKSRGSKNVQSVPDHYRNCLNRINPYLFPRIALRNEKSK
jgi:hypothetical protein